MTARSRKASAVPEDIVRAVYTLGFQQGALTLHDRLRGLAVCRGWRDALSELPIPLVEIHDGKQAHNICRWATLAQPRIQELHQRSALDLVVQAVHSIQRKLAQLPALAELDLHGGYGRAALLASGPAAQLQGLTCLLGKLSVDFSALPGLKDFRVTNFVQLVGGASIAAATALTRVELTEWHQGWEHGSALEVLKNLPRSVKLLHLMGDWPVAAAALVGSLQGLVALDLEYVGAGQPALPVVGMPVWTSLRAISWVVVADVSLPQVLRQASNLEALQVWLEIPSASDVELITSLPALRKISLPIGVGAVEADRDPYGHGARRAQRAAAGCAIRRAKPHIHLEEPAFALHTEDFSRWALE
ncbi:hypothetical protein N2152v2_000952 [Parachlorella kessleri]